MQILSLKYCITVGFGEDINTVTSNEASETIVAVCVLSEQKKFSYSSKEYNFK